MSRMPAFLLPDKVTLYPLAAPSGRGGARKDENGRARAALVELRPTLRVDERTDSATAGTEIVMSTRVIVQVEDYQLPGSRIVLDDGTEVQVANARRYRHPNAPSNAELWAV